MFFFLKQASLVFQPDLSDFLSRNVVKCWSNVEQRLQDALLVDDQQKKDCKIIFILLSSPKKTVLVGESLKCSP